MGLLFVLLAIVGWGIGDFLIQRSARKLGDWEALFFITLFATIVLSPFVVYELHLLSATDFLILGGTSVVILVAGLLDFEALRVGKISVIEPIYALEIPITVALATLVIGEILTSNQIVLVLILLAGIFLVSNKQLGGLHRRMLEKGVLTAILATIGMGLANFLFGFAARETGPLMINWFTSAFMAAATLLYLLYTHRGGDILHSWRKNKRLILAVGFFDNVAWVSYSTSVLYLPIAIATSLSEIYIALGAILGLMYNREKLHLHQKGGLIISVAAAMALAFISEF